MMQAYKKIDEKKDEKVDSRIPKRLVEKAKEIKGFSFQDINIHYNSSEPSKINANAYAIKNDIYLRQGKEYLLEHELGHIVQQRKENFQPNAMINQTCVHHNQKVEQEADHLFMNTSIISPIPISNVIQGDFTLTLSPTQNIMSFDLGRQRFNGPLPAGDHTIANVLIYRYQEHMLLNKHISQAITFYAQFTQELVSEAAISPWFVGEKKDQFDKAVDSFNTAVTTLNNELIKPTTLDVRLLLKEVISTFNILYVLSPSATYGPATKGKGETGARALLNDLIISKD